MTYPARPGEVRQTRVRRVDTANRTVVSTRGHEIACDRLLIATGAHPVKPPIEGMDEERIETVHFGRMPQPHKAAPRFRGGRAEDDARCGARSGAWQAPGPARGDDCRRAHDNWRYLDALAPQGTAMVDLYHAAQQLKSGLDVCYEEGNTKEQAHYEKLRHPLRHERGGVEKLIRSLNHLR